MRRIGLTIRPPVLVGLVMLVALVALLPMPLALGWLGAGEQGLSARAVSGSIWSGTLTEARFAGLALGDVDAAVSPLDLLLGRARIALKGRETVRGLHGSMIVSRHGFGVDSMTARFATGALFAPLPVTALDLDAFTVRFRDDRCESAQGRIRATLSDGAGGIALPQSVSGSARCDAGTLLLPLVSQDGMAAITLRVTAAGTYHGELAIRAGDPAAAGQLTAAGFVPGRGGYRLSIEGRF